MKTILKFFPDNIKQELEKENICGLEEIRLRASKPIILKYHTFDKILNNIILPEDILETLSIMCSKSIYSYQKQICDGFITVERTEIELEYQVAQ